MTELPVIASHELFAASELEVQVCRLPSGEEIVRFVDCTMTEDDDAPVIYKWCLENAVKWLQQRDSAAEEKPK